MANEIALAAARAAYMTSTGAELHQVTGWLDDALEAAITAYMALDAKPDPALLGIAAEMKESGGHWMPCTGCYDTEDGHPTQKYAYSPALQTDIGCGCHECGGLGAVWWHMTDEELAQFEKECAGIDATEPTGGDHG